jgi:hypothetical protein
MTPWYRRDSEKKQGLVGGFLRNTDVADEAYYDKQKG